MILNPLEETDGIGGGLPVVQNSPRGNAKAIHLPARIV